MWHRGLDVKSVHFVVCLDFHSWRRSVVSFCKVLHLSKRQLPRWGGLPAHCSSSAAVGGRCIVFIITVIVLTFVSVLWKNLILCQIDPAGFPGCRWCLTGVTPLCLLRGASRIPPCRHLRLNRGSFPQILPLYRFFIFELFVLETWEPFSPSLTCSCFSLIHSPTYLSCPIGPLISSLLTSLPLPPPLSKSAPFLTQAVLATELNLVFIWD